MHRILVATSNKGKLRDFAGAAALYGIEIAGILNLSSLPSVVEDAPSFEGNAQKKAEFYSLHTAGEPVLSDDSGLEVDALGGAPGVLSARYACEEGRPDPTDAENNSKLLSAMKTVPDEQRTARFVCVLALAQRGKTIATFRGEAEGLILREPQGTDGFGYDPLFLFPSVGKTFAELTAEEKSSVSHRGRALREFLNWSLRV